MIFIHITQQVIFNGLLKVDKSKQIKEAILRQNNEYIIL